MSANGGRGARGAAAYRLGHGAEQAASLALERDGWQVLGRRLRTPAGEIDLVVQRDDMLVFVEVKARASLSDAAWAITPRQQRRLLAAAEVVLAMHPEWSFTRIRFDALLVDSAGRVRRVTDVLRGG